MTTAARDDQRCRRGCGLPRTRGLGDASRILLHSLHERSPPLWQAVEVVDQRQDSRGGHRALGFAGDDGSVNEERVVKVSAHRAVEARAARRQIWRSLRLGHKFAVCGLVGGVGLATRDRGRQALRRGAGRRIRLVRGRAAAADDAE